MPDEFSSLFAKATWHGELPVILYLTGLNYYGLLKPFLSPYIDVYVFAMWFYITSDTKKSDFYFLFVF